MGKLDTYGQILRILVELHKKYPNYSLGRHISTATSEYRDLWGVEDTAILQDLKRYEQELDYIPQEEPDIEKIIEEGKNLAKLFQSEEENEEL